MPLLQGFMSQFSSKQNSKEVAKPLNTLWQNISKEPEHNDSQKLCTGINQLSFDFIKWVHISCLELQEVK